MRKLQLNFNNMLYIAYILLFFVMFLSFFYGDILVTSELGSNLWDYVFAGKLRLFYENNVIECGGTKFGSLYNILVYLFFAVWTLPLKLLSIIESVDFTAYSYMSNNVFCLIWIKIFIVLSTVYVLKLLKDIVSYDNKTSNRWKYVLGVFSTSILCLASTMIMTRYDMLCNIFMLLELRSYIRNEDKKFVLWAAIAFCFNYFSVLIFIPLIFLRIKNIKSIINNFIYFIIPFLITKLPFWGHPLNKAINEGNLTRNLFYMLFSKEHGVFSVFAVGYLLLLLFCFCIDIHSRDDKLQIYSWICTTAFFLLFGFCFCYPYWPILLLPFSSLLIGLSNKNYDIINLIVETVSMAGLILGNMLIYHWCFFGTVCSYNTLWRFLLSSNDGSYVKVMHYINILNANNVGYILCHSVFIAGMISILIINFPFKNWQICEYEFFSFKDANYRKAQVFRYVCTFGVCLLPLLGLVR